jgi:hypothetical protein
MVIKENFSRDMVDLLAHDMRTAIGVAEHGRSARPHRARHRPLY